MSEPKTIKLKFNDKEVEIPTPNTYNEVRAEYIKQFAIEEKYVPNLSLFYYDADGDQIAFQADNDYDLFIKDDSLEEKIIEGEIDEKDKDESINVEISDPLKSGQMFSKKFSFTFFKKTINLRFP